LSDTSIGFIKDYILMRENIAAAMKQALKDKDQAALAQCGLSWLP
jgi:hypothetical protein